MRSKSIKRSNVRLTQVNRRSDSPVKQVDHFHKNILCGESWRGSDALNWPRPATCQSFSSARPKRKTSDSTTWH